MASALRTAAATASRVLTKPVKLSKTARKRQKHLTTLTLEQQLAVDPSTLPKLKGHLASQPVVIPPNVTVTTLPPPNPEEDPKRILNVTGPHGTQTFGLFYGTYVDTSVPGSARITSIEDGLEKRSRAEWGLVRAMLSNMITGVTDGFTTNLRLVGVGYRAAVEPGEKGGQRLRMKLGFSHDVLIDVPEGIKADVPKPTEITLFARRKDALGQFAADIRKWRKPEPYNGKGIFVNDETIKLKQVRR